MWVQNTRRLLSSRTCQAMQHVLVIFPCGFDFTMSLCRQMLKGWERGWDVQCVGTKTFDRDEFDDYLCVHIIRTPQALLTLGGSCCFQGCDPARICMLCKLFLLKSSDEAGCSSRVAALAYPGFLQNAVFGAAQKSRFLKTMLVLQQQ